MKKLILALCILGFYVSAYGQNNQERISELQQETQELQARAVEYQQILSNIQIRLIQIEAITGELAAQDKTVEVDDEPTDG